MTYRIISGTVASDGKIKRPASSDMRDFRVVYDSKVPGNYEIRFDPPFLEVIGGSVTQIYISFSGDLRDNAIIRGIDEMSVKIATGDVAGKPSNRDFTFMVVGIGRAP